MATKIRGITVQIGGDTTGLQKSLSDVNKKISNTQSQLKDVEKLLKLDPKNTELLAQRQKLLTQAIEQSREKLQALKEAEAQLRSQGVDENSEQFMALQREIASTSAELGKLATNSGVTAKTFSEKFSSALTSVKGKITTVISKFKSIGSTAVSIAKSVLSVGYSALTTADDLNTLSKQTGISTADLQKFTYAADLVDVSTSDITSALQRMKRNLSSTSVKWDEYGISIRDAEGNLRDTSDIFYDTLDVLSKIENETERDTVAMAIFGRGADALAGIIDDGGQALKEYGAYLEEIGGIKDQATLDQLNNANDAVDKLKMTLSSKLSVALADFVEEYADDIIALIEGIVKHLPEFFEIIKALATIVCYIYDKIVQLVNWIVNNKDTISGTAESIGTGIKHTAALFGNPVEIYNLIKELINKDNSTNVEVTFSGDMSSLGEVLYPEIIKASNRGGAGGSFK